MPVIRAALGRGQKVRMTVNGSSMLPFIRDGETVELVPPSPSPLAGDIVLVEIAEALYVVHRIIQIEGDMIFLRGDAQKDREGPFPYQAVLGRVITTNSRGGVRALDHGPWYWAGLVWMRSGLLGYIILQFALRLRGVGGTLRRRFLGA